MAEQNAGPNTLDDLLVSRPGGVVRTKTAGGLKLLALQARVQADQLAASHRVQIEREKAQADAIHLQVKTQGEIELARIKAALEAKMTVLETHLKAAIEAGKVPRSYPPGARKARDGHHYVPDPNRPGKHLLVVHHG